MDISVDIYFFGPKESLLDLKGSMENVIAGKADPWVAKKEWSSERNSAGGPWWLEGASVLDMGEYICLEMGGHLREDIWSPTLEDGDSVRADAYIVRMATEESKRYPDIKLIGKTNKYNYDDFEGDCYYFIYSGEYPDCIELNSEMDNPREERKNLKAAEKEFDKRLAKMKEANKPKKRSSTKGARS